jgi:hypothetical protein
MLSDQELIDGLRTELGRLQVPSELLEELRSEAVGARGGWRGARSGRRRAGALVVAAAAVAVVVGVVIVFATSVGSSRHASPIPAVGGSASTLCGVSGARRLSERPPTPLMSILGVLRRPQNAQDRPALLLQSRPRPGGRAPSGIGGVIEENGLPANVPVARSQSFVYMKYVRRARTLDGTSYYLIPIVSGVDLTHAGRCVHPYIGLQLGTTRGHHNGSESCCSNRGQILAARGGGSISSDSGAATVGGFVVPDGVATVTLKFGSPSNAGDQGGRSSQGSTTASATGNVVGNVAVMTFPGPPYSDTPKATVWKSPDGKVIKTRH